MASTAAAAGFSFVWFGSAGDRIPVLCAANIWRWCLPSLHPSIELEEGATGVCNGATAHQPTASKQQHRGVWRDWQIYCMTAEQTDGNRWWPNLWLVDVRLQTKNAVNILWTIAALEYPGAGYPLCINHLFRWYMYLLILVHRGTQTWKASHRLTTTRSRMTKRVTMTSSTSDVRCVVDDMQHLSNQYLSLADCLHQLQDDTAGCTRVPNGIKEKVWFKVRVICTYGHNSNFHFIKWHVLNYSLSYCCSKSYTWKL